MAPTAILIKITLAEASHRRQSAGVRNLWRKFGLALRKERRRRGIPLKEFSARLGISPAMVSYLESGKREWGIERASMAARLLTRRQQWPD